MSRWLVILTLAVLSPFPTLAQTKITVGHVSRTTTMWPYFVGEAKGFFKDEKLELDNVVVGNAAAVAQQTTAGSLDISNTTFELVIQAVENGAPLSIIGATAIKYAFSMYSAKDVKTAADLRGKPVMVPVPKNDIANFFEAWLGSNGMKPADVEIIYNGSSPNRFAALTSGAVAAVALGTPLDFAADAAGYNKLVDFGKFVQGYGFLAMLGRKDWLAKNRPATEALIRALSRATDWLYDPANRNEAVEILMRETKQDRDVSEKSYDYVVTQLQSYSRGLRVPDADLVNVVKAFQDFGVVKNRNPPIERYLDRSFLK